ncbi:MAG TPA: PA14 domain-containing protein, partial [Gemmata sp.]
MRPARWFSLGRVWDHLLSTRKAAPRPRLGLEALEAREVPAVFAIHLLAEASDSAATHASTIALAAGDHAADGALLVTADTAAEAAAEALSGQVDVSFLGQSATYVYSPDVVTTDPTAHDQPYLLSQPDAGQPNLWRVGLEDLQAANLQSLGGVDWDYNDRTWDLDVRAYQAPVVGTGTGLLARYFNARDLTALGLVRVDPQVNNDWGAGSPDASIGADHFSVRWSGQVQAEYAENYVFKTVSDDGVRLWIDGNLVIDDWTDHGPTADASAPIAMTPDEKHDIVMEYYEDGGGATAQLLWSSASQPEQAVPQTQLYPEDQDAPVIGDGDGLTGQYFADQNLTTPSVARIDPTVAFDWGGGSPDPEVDPDHFSAQWTGQVMPAYSGTYTFYTQS